MKYVKWMLSQRMLWADFWGVIFLSAASPMTHKFLMENVSSQLIAFKGMVMSLGIIVVNSAFNKWGDRIFKWYRELAIAEIVILGFLVVTIATNTITASTYFLCEAFTDMIVCRNLVCCNNRLRRYVYGREEREVFDNSRPIAESVACIIGNSVAMLTIPMGLAWTFWFIGVALSDILYWMVYKKAVK